MTLTDIIGWILFSILLTWILSIIVLTVVDRLRDYRVQQFHDIQDSDCVYWTGDRAGYNLLAVCKTCEGVRREQRQA